MGGDGVRVRRAGAGDAEAVAAVAQAAYARYLPAIDPAPGPLSADYAMHVADDEVWVAEVDGAVVGFVILMPDTDSALLDNIAVLPSAQGTGIGRLLLDLAERRALESGVTSVRLYTNAGMTDNLAIYAAHGYVETTRDNDPKGRPRVWLRKDLVPTSSHVWTDLPDLDHLADIRARRDELAPNGALHLLLEAVVYPADEATWFGGGSCHVTLHADGSVEVNDDGRGTAVQLREDGTPIRKPIMSTRDLRFFDEAEPPLLPDSFARRGVSVVAALSTWLVHTNRRAEGAWTQRYEHGVPVGDLTPVASDGTTGTTMRFLPDPDLAPLPHDIDLPHLAEAWPALTLTLTDHRALPDDLAEVVRLEKALLDPAVRSDATRVEGMLHPDFVEFGSSGRVWDRASIVAELVADPGVPRVATALDPLRLADDVVLLTYRLVGDPGSLRSSIWLRTNAGWHLRFHQGTRLPG